MPESRRWYTERETFVAVAALIVSISAVAVGIYEASLQRHHDRAEVWPHVEIQLFYSDTGVTLSLENSGIGPAIVETMIVSVDSQPRRSWLDVLTAMNGGRPKTGFSYYSATQHALRSGERLDVVHEPRADLPDSVGRAMARTSIYVCYGSVFEQFWSVSVAHLGRSAISWTPVKHCPAQPDSTDF